MSSSANEPKKFLLQSADGELFEVDELEVMQSQTIRRMIEDGCANAVIPLPNVTSKILSKVLEYCKRHVNDYKADPSDLPDFELQKIDTQFAEGLDQETQFELILAANYLHIEGLLDLVCEAVADMIQGKTPAQIRDIFDIKNDFTPEEEEKLRQEFAWAFKDMH